MLVADDHPVYVDGLAAAIKRTGDLDLLGTCTNGAEALERIRAESPDVAVLDLRMPRLGAAEVLQELAAEETPCRVLVLSFHVGGEQVHECLSLGAAGYVAKDADRAEICEAIRGNRAGPDGPLQRRPGRDGDGAHAAALVHAQPPQRP